MNAVPLPPAAVAMLADIDAWSDRTGYTPGQLGQMVLNHGGFVPLLRKRGSLNPNTADRLRLFMQLFPDREALPDALGAALIDAARAGAGWDPSRHRSMLVRLGYPLHPSLPALGGGQAPKVETPAPSPAPEGKPRVSADVIRASKLDGRDLPTFVTALINMGLECWRDDRVEHGEPVA